MELRPLSKEAFLATFSAPMRDITQREDEFSPSGVLDIWPYVNSIPPQQLEGRAIRDGLVERVYRDGAGRFDHVLVLTEQANVYVVVVIDLARDRIHGHHLLNLLAEYGLDAANEG